MSALDCSLDALINKNKSSSKPSRGRGGGGGGGRGRGTGGTRGGAISKGGRGGRGGVAVGGRQQQRRTQNIARGVVAMSDDMEWKHDMFQDGRVPASQRLGGAKGGISTGTKLYISNLDFNVTNEDIKELFFKFGKVNSSGVHFDRSGRSKGTAEVVFARVGDAKTAQSQYNGVKLDGKPMQIQVMAGGGAEAVVSTARVVKGRGTVRAVTVNFAGGGGRGAGGRGAGGRGAGRGRGGGGRGGRGAGRGGRGGRERENVNAGDLDSALDAYMAVE